MPQLCAPQTIVQPERSQSILTAGSCDWCGGSGTWTDEDGNKWPCIKCRHGRTGDDN